MNEGCLDMQRVCGYDSHDMRASLKSIMHVSCTIYMEVCTCMCGCGCGIILQQRPNGREWELGRKEGRERAHRWSGCMGLSEASEGESSEESSTALATTERQSTASAHDPETTTHFFDRECSKT